MANGTSKIDANSIRDLINESRTPSVPGSAADIRSLIQQQQTTQPQQRGGLLPPPDQPIRGGALAQATPALRQATQAATGVDTSPGVFDIVTGRSRMTPEMEALPELATVLGERREKARQEFLKAKKERGFFTPEREEFERQKQVELNNFISIGLSSSPEERQNILRQSIPGIDFSTDEKGNVIVRLPDGELSALNTPGLSGTDFQKIISEFFKFLPAARLPGIVGGGVARRIGAGALGAAATQAASEAASVPLGGEVDVSEIAIAGALGGAAEAVGPAISGVRNIARARRAGATAAEFEAVAPSIREAQAATEATGIPLFQAQQTGIPAQLERQSFVAQLPAGTQASIKGLKAQNKAAGEAVESFLESVAPAEALETGAVRFRSAAEKVVAFKKAIRKEFTSDFFKDAFAEKPTVNLKPVRDLLDKNREKFPIKAGKFKTSLDEVESLIKGDVEIIPGSPILDAKGRVITRETKKIVDPTLEQLHGAKVLIDDMIGRTGEDSVGNTARGILQQIQISLLEQMDSASDLYRVARQRFAQESPLVDRVKKGLLGRIEKVKDPQLKSISQSIFDAAETNPTILQRTKRAIDLADPEAWNELLRVELERRIGSVRPGLIGTAGESVENVPGQLFRAIFGNDKQTKVLMRALSPDQRKNLTFLQTALRRASLGRPGGSQTAGREEIKQELRGGVMSAISKFFEPIKALSEGLRGTTFDRRTRVLAEALFDPQWKPRMDKLRKIDMRTPAAAKAMTQLLNDIEQSQPQEPEPIQ